MQQTASPERGLEVDLHNSENTEAQQRRTSTLCLLLRGLPQPVSPEPSGNAGVQFTEYWPMILLRGFSLSGNASASARSTGGVW